MYKFTSMMYIGLLRILEMGSPMVSVNRKTCCDGPTSHLLSSSSSLALSRSPS
ncbi:hypothetical protein HanRHA438_Chr11g0505651 [Helianthus annuus]|nr:hypothetical protein HanHA300_Chr11g0404111 [Helianthus annuus]KAJ0517637.1 hypothetical protein HanHA89_Chr11g0427751 [Helianthus annuus]KAJ0685651.1 hypothetical protein HanLR1_Chr11g0405231 [Helianthus annuus]KAJ0870887.1 hypothetical protein HanRHA438_Chr11g0505651 [Helianthus annuus]